MKAVRLCLVFLFLIGFLSLKTPSKVFGRGCGCTDFATLVTECKELLIKNPCPELQKCKCEPTTPLSAFVLVSACGGVCVDDPNDPHCNPRTVGGDKTEGIRTAIGCIPLYNFQDFIGWVFPKVIFIASGIAFLLMVLGVFQLITSSGDPKKAQAAKELITSALSGLLFIILSMFLLKLIGVDILKIPGFGN